MIYLRLGVVLYMFGLGNGQARGHFTLLGEIVRPLFSGLVVIDPTTREVVILSIITSLDREPGWEWDGVRFERGP